MSLLISNLYFDNSIDAYIPELWAQESLAILEENMVIANLVHRDFSPTIAKYGDTVNTRRPSQFTAHRKTVNDDVTVQAASATNIPVVLNQLVHTSFMIRDGEESKSFKDLVAEFLRPAILAQARFVDQVLLAQYAQFMDNRAGKLGGLTSSTAKAYMLDARKIMNVNKAPEYGRNLIWTPNAETEVLKLDLFIGANTVGDDGTAMRRASLGDKLGFQNFMCQNMASIATTDLTDSGAVNNASGYNKGDTSITVDGLSGAISANTWVTIDGDPHRVVSTTGGSTPTVLVLREGLNHAVLNDDVVTVVDPGAVNLVAGYAAGYAKEILVDGFTIFPQVGQMVSFGTSTANAVYTIIQASSTDGTIVLDRPLEAALSNDDKANVSPMGEYNFAFERDAVALVIRPLAAPNPITGVLSSVLNFNGLSVRVTITYQGLSQGVLVTLDMLMGVAILDTNLGAVLLG